MHGWVSLESMDYIQHPAQRMAQGTLTVTVCQMNNSNSGSLNLVCTFQVPGSMTNTKKYIHSSEPHQQTMRCYVFGHVTDKETEASKI